MTRLLAIARNTFLQSVRQPVYFFVLVTTLVALAGEVAMTAWTLEDDDKLLRDFALSTLLVQGLFLSAVGASKVISGEIEDKTVLTVAAKPVNRLTIILGKFLGVFAALVLAHYIGTIGLFMALRHGVLQMSSQTYDVSVLIAGPGVVLLALIAAGMLNYLFDRAFFGSVIGLFTVGLSFGALTLVFVDRNGHLRAYECIQGTPGLPKGLDPKDFAGIISYRDETPVATTQPTGVLIRREWLGPISDAERATLLSLSEDDTYRKNLGFLIEATRKLVTPQVLKAAILLVGVLAILAAFAVAVSTRCSTTWTILLTLALVVGGLVADYYLGFLAGSTEWWASFARGLLHALPDFRFFWLVDAITWDAVIPWRYLLSCFAYAGVYTAGLIAVGAALFETREVG